jgi:hypothetical protein
MVFGQVLVDDNECSGSSSIKKMTGNVDNIRELTHKDCCQTILLLADTVAISCGVHEV